MAILYDKKSLLENKKFVETVSSIYTVAPEEAADRVEALVNEHKRSFGADAADTVLFSAPGRIEVVGNHTDHNNGKVIAAAISVDLLGAVSETKDNKIVVNSIGYPSVSVDITDLEPKEDEKGDSAALVRGIVKAFVDRGLNVGGFIATTTSDVFKGAGMSSSASFELFVAEVLNSFYNGGVVSAIDKAIISQYAENVYFGKPSGLMDQMAISVGGASYIDFKDPKAPLVEKMHWPFENDMSVFVVNCGGDHCNLTPNYAAIMTEMRAIAGEFGQEKLRFVDKGEFYSSIGALKDKYSGRAILRAMHYFEENERVDEMKQAIADEDPDLACELITESGFSSMTKLQNCYPEGDFSEPIPLALSLTQEYAGTYAYRVHGGGFAGTILAMVAPDAEEYGDYMGLIYGAENVHKLKIRDTGAMRLDLESEE